MIWYTVILWDATRILPLRDVAYLPTKKDVSGNIVDRV
jgi:hypothetical protein